MSSNKDGVASDTEGGEKPVRKQLQKASISRASGETLDTSAEEDASLLEKTAQAETAEQEDGSGKPEATQGLRKKRSHEEIEDADMDGRPPARTVNQHGRKRSRDSTADEDELNNGRKIPGERKRGLETDVATSTTEGSAEVDVKRPGTPDPNQEEKVESVTSPKTKRSRLHSTTADEDAAAATAIAGKKDSNELDDEGDSTAARENAQPAAQSTTTGDEKAKLETQSPAIPSGSGFANTSATSPFGAMAPPKSPPSDQQQTSSSAFAASGFGSLAGSATSGFGALGKSAGGPSGGWSSKKPLSTADDNGEQNGTEKTSTTFGGALGQQSGFGAAEGNSAFGSSGSSAFGGKLGSGGAFGGSGFGSLGGAASLSSFASGKASPFASGTGKPVKLFGFNRDEDDEDGDGADHDGDDGGESGLKSPLSQTSDKQDERFYVQDHETGEEGEVTEYSCRAKLYNFAVVDEEKGKKAWKEAGLGTMRLNTARPAAGEEGDKANAKGKARLVMRADGSHRLVLNTPVQKNITFGAIGGGPPHNGLLLFMGTVDGRKALETLQLKMKQQFALELYEKIKELQAAM